MPPISPRPPLAIVIVTHVFLGSLFVIGALALLLLPRVAAIGAESAPEYARITPALLALSITFTLLAMATLVILALLVARIFRGTVLTRSSLGWVDAIIVAVATGAAIVLATMLVITSAGVGNAPIFALFQITAMLALAALAGIGLVLRSLLRHAIFLRAELDEVV